MSGNEEAKRKDFSVFSMGVVKMLSGAHSVPGLAYPRRFSSYIRVRDFDYLDMVANRVCIGARDRRHRTQVKSPFLRHA